MDDQKIKKAKLGIVCYSSQTGLGYQTKGYVDNLSPVKVMVVDLSQFNKMPIHKDWYENKSYQVVWVDGIPNTEEINQFLEGLDIVFMAETPLNYYLIEEAHRRGIKTINAMNYEFCDYFKHPDWSMPTALAMPTVWNLDVVQGLCPNSKVFHLPVAIERFSPPREIKELKTVMHVIGRPAVMDRNGTLTFLSAIERLGDQFQYQVFVQRPRDIRAMEYFEPVQKRLYELIPKLGIEVYYDTADIKTMFGKADLHVLPRRYGGLCLPMTDSLSVGMPVIMTDISPNNARLPQKWLVPARQIDTFRGHATVPVYEADVDALVAKVLDFADPTFMQAASIEANAIAETLLWSKQRDIYLSTFVNL